MKADAARAFIEPPFVGRASEIGLLERACEDARTGRGSVVLIAGEAGIGKTRILTEAARAIGDFRVLWGRCRAMEGAPPYWPWMQIADAMGAGAENGATRLFDSAALQSTRAGQAGGVGAAAETDPAQWRFRFFHSLSTFLRDASERSPLLLLLEDLHWADSESLQLAGFLADDIRDRRILAVGTHRPITAATASARAAFSQLAQKARRIELAPLSRVAVDEVIAACCGVLPARTVDEIFTLTEGNPFFLRELSGLFATRRENSPLALPEHIRETVQQRLAQLPNASLAMLRIAAVAGREFDPAEIAAVAACDDKSVRMALESPVDHGIVVDGGAFRRFRFAHALIQAVLYADEPRASRARMHRLFADVLAARGAGDPDGIDGTIAYHYFAAGDRDSLERAAEAALRAGDRARATLGYEAAASHYERVLETYAVTGAAVDRRLPVTMACGEALWCANDFEGARARFLEAMQIARRGAGATALAQAVIGLATTLSPAGAGVPDPVLISALEEAARALAGTESALHARVLARLAAALYYTPHVDRRLQLADTAVLMARACADAEALAAVLLHRHRVMLGAAPLEERRAVAIEAFEVATAIANDELACEARLMRVQDELESGDLAAAIAELESASHVADAHSLLRQQWTVLRARATFAMLAGRFEEAERFAGATLEVATLGRTRDAEQFFGGQMSQVRRLQGRLDELLPMIAAFVENNPTMPIWRAALAMAELQAGNRDKARAAIESLVTGGLDAIPQRDLNWLPILACAAEAIFESGDRRRGAQIAAWLERHAGKWIVLNVLVGALGPVLLFLGMSRHAAGDRAGAIDALERAVADSDRLGALPSKARAQAALATVLAGDAQAEEVRVRSLRTEALALARAAGMAGLVRQIEEAVQSGSAEAAEPVTSMPDRDVAASFVMSPEIATTPSNILSSRRRATLRRQGDFWIVACDDEATHVKHRKGLEHLRFLLLHPGRDLHVLELAGIDESTADGDVGETVDAAARDAYRRRLRELREELEEAEANHDDGRVGLAQQEIAALEEELRRAFGLGGRVRRQGAAAEKARINVARALSAAMRAIEADCPVLGRHLSNAVRTGMTCRYDPDPGLPLDWTL